MRDRIRVSLSSLRVVLAWLGCVCVAGVAFSSVVNAAGPTLVRGSDGVYQVDPGRTVGSGGGASYAQGTGASTVTKGAGQAMSQRIPGKVILDTLGMSKSLPATLSVTGPTVAAAAVRCLTRSVVCGAAVFGAATGIQSWLDSHDFTIDDDGYLARQPANPVDVGDGGVTKPTYYIMGTYYGAHQATCAAAGLTYDYDCNPGLLGSGDTLRSECDKYYEPLWSNPKTRCIAKLGVGTKYQTRILTGVGCPAGTTGPNASGLCVYGVNPPERLLPAEVESSIADYDPDPSDWPWLTKGIDFSVDDGSLTLDSPVEIVEPEVVITERDGAGNVTGTKGTVKSHNVGASSSSNGTSHPELVVETKTTTTTYDSAGNPTGSSEETTVSGSGSGDKELPKEPLTGCALYEPFCIWAEWTREPLPPEAAEPFSEFPVVTEIEVGDLDVDWRGQYVCPAPVVIDGVSVFTGHSWSVSYQPVCDLAGLSSGLIIAFAWVGAGLLVATRS